MRCPLPQLVTAASLDFSGIPQHNRTARPATLRFAPPVSVKVVGSFLLRTMTLPKPCIDVAVEMPTGCFTDKDMKNYVYHDKRSLYLGVLAKHLQAVEGIKRLELESFGMDTGKPVLLVTPSTAT